MFGGNDIYEKYDVPGPCWDNYVYIGPEVGVTGSCIKKSKLCKKEPDLELCRESSDEDSDDESNSGLSEKNIKLYRDCIPYARDRFNNNSLKLCPEGYCTAKHKFEVYPSAYANGYAAKVCKGSSPNFLGETSTNQEYIDKLDLRSGSKEDNELNRWFKEQWVNVCESGEGPGGYALCGSGEGVDNPDEYPYCRAYYKLDNTDVITIEELNEYLPNELDSIFQEMCNKKRSHPQGVNGKPTRVNLPDDVIDFIKNKRVIKENL